MCSPPVPHAAACSRMASRSAMALVARTHRPSSLAKGRRARPAAAVKPVGQQQAAAAEEVHATLAAAAVRFAGQQQGIAVKEQKAGELAAAAAVVRPAGQQQAGWCQACWTPAGKMLRAQGMQDSQLLFRAFGSTRTEVLLAVLQ